MQNRSTPRSARIAAALTLLAGCAPAAPGLPVLEELNVLLVVLDTVGAEQVGVEDSDHSPHLDRLAREGIVFRNAYTTAPWTQPAVASLFTSQMPSRHGVVRLFDRLSKRNVTLAEELKARGFETAGVVSHDLLRRKYGFGQGFDHYDERHVGGHRAITSERVTDAAIDWLERRMPSDRRFFLLVHYFDPHFAYNHHPSHDLTSGYAGPLHPGMRIWELRNQRDELEPADIAYLIGLHREEIAYTDEQLGRLLDRLRTLGLDDRTLVVVVGDHGEEFMRHGWIGHTRTLYDELVHVPLIFRFPGSVPPRAIDWPVSILDVMPTLLALSEHPSQPPEAKAWAGISLLPWLFGPGAGGKPPDRDLFAEVSFGVDPNHPDFIAQKSAFETALIGPRWKLIHDLTQDRWELYDRTVDAAELDDRAVAEPHAELRERLLEWERSRDAGPGTRAERVHATDVELERLRALGYVK